MTPYPGPGEHILVSVEGGEEPVWSRDGRELFFRRGDALLSVSVLTEPTFSAGVPEVVFRGSFEVTISRSQNYDVSLDGQRFLMVRTEEDPGREFVVVLNWLEELSRLAPLE